MISLPATVLKWAGNEKLRARLYLLLRDAPARVIVVYIIISAPRRGAESLSLVSGRAAAARQQFMYFALPLWTCELPNSHHFSTSPLALTSRENFQRYCPQ